jgi:metal-sulfur cluster biosynthetic enzyme
LVYELKVSNEGDVFIKIGATSPYCPVTDFIAYSVTEAFKNAIPARKVDVEIDLKTQWTPLKMTNEGRKNFIEINGYDIVELWLQRFSNKLSNL